MSAITPLQAWEYYKDAVKSIENMADCSAEEIHNNVPISDSIAIIEDELKRSEELRSILTDILYHDERGQGVGYSEAMERARDILKGRHV